VARASRDFDMPHILTGARNESNIGASLVEPFIHNLISVWHCFDRSMLLSLSGLDWRRDLAAWAFVMDVRRYLIRAQLFSQAKRIAQSTMRLGTHSAIRSSLDFKNVGCSGSIWGPHQQKPRQKPAAGTSIVVLRLAGIGALSP
jgi:hypothetical protein